MLIDSLRHQGAQVKNLLCDNCLSSCDMFHRDQVDQNSACQSCFIQRSSFKQKYPCDFLSMKQFITPDEMLAFQNLVNQLSDFDLQTYKFEGAEP